jgi:hypothetical protein
LRDVVDSDLVQSALTDQLGRHGEDAFAGEVTTTSHCQPISFGATLEIHCPSPMSLPLYGATFGQALSRFFRSYARFSGRASRSEY